ncbi:sensor histidine kinase [Cellulomonas triticagri]|uniref:histidine kinase n=1 Tax=Cellulomonas triticagri TaxID=2483352 RepID=A0A3M2J0N8_9CELL|nr:HAMP domain-containing sensor histidine kinase [Cellulomonas triticagri]RMI06959.1 sensor histidine kinase [Cellulomonas triticagri]
MTRAGPLPRRRSPRRRSLRVRLTALYAGAAAVSGAVLVAVTYAFVASTIADQPLDTVMIALPEATLDGTGDLLTGEGLTIQDVAAAVTEVNEQSRAEILTALLRWSGAALLLAVALAAVVGRVVASRAVAPLHQITATARRVADDNLHSRIGLDGPRDEITDLADTFDAMLERLDRSFDGQRRFVAHASHELRTPLTITRTVLEVALDDPATPAETRALGEQLLAVNARHERLIDGLLTLATSQGAPVAAEDVDLVRVVRTVLASAAHEVAARGVRLELDLEPAPLRGDPLLLERLVQNLVDNAVRYNDPSGFVRIRTGTVGGAAEVEVTNAGPRVPSDDVPSLFEPFRQLGPDGAERHRREGYLRGGVGLGLPVVLAVTEAHGGEVDARARDSGGLRVRVRLPHDPGVVAPAAPGTSVPMTTT